jgi:hypothetical protein
MAGSPIAQGAWRHERLDGESVFHPGFGDIDRAGRIPDCPGP